MARISLAREADCKPAVAGFDSQARLHGPWPRGQGGSLLRSRRAFESRRADGGAHVIAMPVIQGVAAGEVQTAVEVQ